MTGGRARMAEPRAGDAGDTGYVTVRLPGPLRELAGGRAEVDVAIGGVGATEAAGGAGPVTVWDVLASLIGRYPGLRRHLHQEDGTLRSHVNVFVGAEDIRHLHGPATGVTPGDEVTIVPSIAGG